jgi:hypothetical protein
MNIKLLAAVMAAVSLSACSTIVNGANQTISFKTGNVEGANCLLTGGSEFAVNEKFVSPDEVEVPRSKKALQLQCTKSGYQEASRSVISKVEATTGGNLLIGGFIGAGVDAATGALYKYPETVILNMVRVDTSEPANTNDPVS